jgi:hypothetical protein
MKKSLLLFFIATCSMVSMAQDYAQFDSTTLQSQPILNLEKSKYLKDVNMIANTRYQYMNDFVNGDLTGTRFALPELRMEVVGKVGNRINFRIRDMYTFRTPTPNDRDNLRNSLDIAQIEFKVNDDLSIAGGRMLPEWGAYEFEINPISILAFNHLIEFGDHFQNGVVVKWKPAQKHLLSFQVVNSRGRSFNTVYGEVPGVEASNFALGGTANWRGSFADGKFSTVYSYSVYNEAKNRNVYMLQLGNQLKLDKLILQYDFKLSNDEIDRLGQVSNLIGSQYAFRAQNVRYIEHWLRAEYFFTEKWSSHVIGMVASDFWFDNPSDLPATDVARDDKLRDSFSFTAAIEYHVYKPQNLRIFAAYVGRFYQHSDYAQSQFGLTDFNTGQIMVGVISPLVFF